MGGARDKGGVAKVIKGRARLGLQSDVMGRGQPRFDLYLIGQIYGVIGHVFWANGAG